MSGYQGRRAGQKMGESLAFIHETLIFEYAIWHQLGVRKSGLLFLHRICGNEEVLANRCSVAAQSRLASRLGAACQVAGR